MRRVEGRRHSIVSWLIAVCLVAAPVGVWGETSATQLFEQGRFDEAEDRAYVRDDADSLRVRARFSLWAGDDERARQFGRAAIEQATEGGQQRRARVEMARLEWLFGDRDSALERLRQVLDETPDDPEVRYELGDRLVRDGDVREGEAILEGAVRRYDDGLVDEIDEMVWVGRALETLKRPREASRVLSRALDLDESHLEANLRLGKLMLEWHNTGEAGEAFERVLAVQPDHPEALVGMAFLEFYRSGRFAEAIERVERAREHFPGHPEVQRARIELLVARGRWAEAQRAAEAFLDRVPEDGRGLALLAAVAHLRADDGLFQEVADRFDRRRSGRPELLATAGEFAAMHNRHRAAIPLFEGAIDRDEGHRGALTGLGMALLRTGREVRGLQVLERAFDADGFDVAVYNTLELFDRGLGDYRIDDVGSFRLRALDTQFSLLESLAGPVVQGARQVFADRYGEVLSELTLEVYDDSEAFSVRSVGMPHVDPHGICFGPVVLTRGPGQEDFNWPMVVWHELAHSYHLARSDERVPMWFTEGLAEYETRLRDGSWTRFRDLEVARRLQHDRLWSLTELDEAFMVGDAEEVPVAYQTAMLFMAWLDEAHGLEVAVEMLDAFADEPDTRAVLEDKLGEPIDVVDDRFRAWLADRYSGLLRQQLVDRARLRAMVQGRQVDHADPVEAAAYRAVAAAMRGDRREAEIQLDNVTRRDGDQEAAGVVEVLAHMMLGDVEEGLSAGRQVLQAGVESVDLRNVMSHLAAEAGRDEEGFVHALAATELAPVDPEGWQRLERRGEAIGEEGAVRRARAERFEREPHDGQLAREETGFFEEIGDYDGAYRAARRWTEIAGLDARAHLAHGRAAAKTRRLETADRAFQRAAEAAPGRRVEIWEAAIEAWSRVDADDRIREYRRRIDAEADDEP